MEKINRYKESLKWTHERHKYYRAQTTMSKLMDEFRIYADLNEDGKQDISDVVIFFKYLAAIYSGLMGIMYVILGENFTTIQDNVYMCVIFFIVAFIIAVFLVILVRNKAERNKIIKKLKETNLSQAEDIYKAKLDAIETNHKNELTSQLNNFLLCVKDNVAREVLDEIMKVYNEFKKGVRP
jgi:uncharacterized membrane protein